MNGDDSKNTQGTEAHALRRGLRGLLLLGAGKAQI